MGEDASGLFNYYARRVEKSVMLKPEEIAVSEYVERTVPKDKSILELAAGAAQLGHLLSLMGYQTAAVEIDPQRYEFAVALGEHVGSSCSIKMAGWQSLKLSRWNLLVTLNAASSHIFPGDTRWLVEYARGGGEFIIRPRQFGTGIPVEIPGMRATLVHEDIYHYAL